MGNEIKLDPIGNRNFQRYDSANKPVKEVTSATEQENSVKSFIKDIVDHTEPPMNEGKISLIKEQLANNSFAIDVEQLASDILYEHGLADEI